MTEGSFNTPEERARQRVQDLTGLVWHGCAYVGVNTFLWIRDLAGGGGLEWAYWTTIPWGIGLAAHGLAYMSRWRRVEDRRYERFLAEERERDERRVHEPH